MARILIIEESDADSQRLQRLLKDHEVGICPSIGRCEQLWQEQWDLIVLDFELPGIFDVNGVLIVHAANPDAAIIVRSGQDQVPECLLEHPIPFVSKQNDVRFLTMVSSELEKRKSP